MHKFHMKYEEISKLDTAKRQLIVAIQLFFERKDGYELVLYAINHINQQSDTK